MLVPSSILIWRIITISYAKTEPATGSVFAFIVFFPV